LDGKRVIGVDLGGTKILAGIVDRDGRVERRRENPTPVSSEDALLAGLDDAVQELLDDEIAAIGFGLPSPIDQVNGRAEQAVNIPLDAGVPFRERMAEKFGLRMPSSTSAPVARSNG
jgi:glucokinase